MRLASVLSVFLLLATGCTPSSKSRTAEVLLAAKAAAGGERLTQIRSSYARLSQATGGTTGKVEVWQDWLTGHHREESQLGSEWSANGFDGEAVWWQDDSRQVRILGVGEARDYAISQAYLVSRSQWFERRPGRVEYLGRRGDGQGESDVLRVSPEGGLALEMWFDARSAHLARTVAGSLITTFSDYRAVDGVQNAFAWRISLGDPKFDMAFTVEDIRLNEPLDLTRFAPPPSPPPLDFGVGGERKTTTVSFRLLNNHIYLGVRLNGQGPFTMLFDTGGGALITPEVARALGLKLEGQMQATGVGEGKAAASSTKVERVEIGEAWLKAQAFLVMDLDALTAVEGVEVQGLIGYEVLQRFIVRVDYERSLLTLWDPAAYVPSDKGKHLAFIFNGHIPRVKGEIDGISAAFDLDTGSRGTLGLLGPFAEQHRLREKYSIKFEGVTGWGIGGGVRSAVARAKLLRLGEIEIRDPVVALTLQQDGLLTHSHSAGNVGGGLLKQFNLVFDYRKQTVVFEPNSNYGKSEPFDRSGMWVRVRDGFFEIMDIVNGGPAEQAGLKNGDRILSVDRKPAAALKAHDLRERFRTEADGTRIRLQIQRQGKVSEIVLVLRTLV